MFASSTTKRRTTSVVQEARRGQRPRDAAVEPQKHGMNDEERDPPHSRGEFVFWCASCASSSRQQERKSAELLRASSNSRRGDR